MRNDFLITCTSPEFSKDELVRLFFFGRSESEIAEVAEVHLRTVQAWKQGRKPVPAPIARLLRLMSSRTVLENSGPWTGAYASGTRLVLDEAAGFGVSIEFEEVFRLKDYRRIYHLGTQQSELIERLMMERDFYRRNCIQQAKYGMLINSIFPSPPTEDA